MSKVEIVLNKVQFSIDSEAEQKVLKEYDNFYKCAEKIGVLSVLKTERKEPVIALICGPLLSKDGTDSRFYIEHFFLDEALHYIDQRGLIDPLYYLKEAGRGGVIENITGYGNDYKGRLKAHFTNDFKGQFQAIFGNEGIIQIAKTDQRSKPLWQLDFSYSGFQLNGVYKPVGETKEWLAKVTKDNQGRFQTDFVSKSTPWPAMPFECVTGFGHRDNLTWVDFVQNDRRKTLIIDPDNNMEIHRENPLSIQYLFETLENEYFK